MLNTYKFHWYFQNNYQFTNICLACVQMPTPVSKKSGKTDEFKFLMFALYLVFQSVYLVLFLGIQHTSLLKSQCIFSAWDKSKG